MLTLSTYLMSSNGKKEVHAQSMKAGMLSKLLKMVQMSDYNYTGLTEELTQL